MPELRFRQVHLDFHTSEKIAGVGAAFDKAQFQDALRRGHVNSITLFSKCHHGMSYHDTTIGKRHPGLTDQLLPLQIEACREIDVKCPIYISAGLDEYAAFLHPEWIAVNREGKQLNPTSAGWKALGFDTPYLDYLVAQIEEVVKNYDAADGIFLDIISPRSNFSPFGLLAMASDGVDPTDPVQVEHWNRRVLENYYRRTTEASRINDPERRVFHNSGHIPKGNRAALQWNSHLELESLPTGGWGYDHFPISAKYAATTGFDFLGMTGKFHTTWGEFGGFKRRNALRYECAAMLAFGAKCSIGDQLHPDGAMNPDTYDLIGAAYAEVEAKEPWCAGDIRPLSNIALVSPEAMHGGEFKGHHSQSLSEQGAARMLLELHQQFDVVDLDRDLSPYKLVILPDEVTLSGAFQNKIAAYLKGGGKLLLSGASGLNPEKTAFALDCGLTLEKRSAFDPDYIVPTDRTPTPEVRGPFVVYGGAYDVTAGTGWETLATRRDPYFNRRWDHFCSHQHTPDALDSEFPAVVSNGQIVYLAHDIFTAYRQLGQMLYRDLIADALKELLPAPRVTASLPSSARVSLMEQTAENRAILHLLFAIPIKRGADKNDRASGTWGLEVIEDLFPLYEIPCTVRLDKPVAAVRLVPSGEDLPFTQEDAGTVTFTVPRLLCHQMVELSFA
jgi:hypothetical protein